MTRLCVLGNSHIASIKLAWEADAAQHPGLTLDFVGAEGTVMRETGLVDGKIAALTPKAQKAFSITAGRSEIDLSAYAGFLLHGAGLQLSMLVGSQRAHRFYGQKVKAENTLSYDYYLQACIDRFYNNTAAGYLLRMLLAGSEAPILVLPTPFPATTVLEDSRAPDHAMVRNIVGAGDQQLFLKLYRDLCRALSRGRVAVLPQPEDTIADGIMTEARFTKGSVSVLREGREHGEDDHRHMNPDYGRVILEQALGFLETEGTRLAALDNEARGDELALARGPALAVPLEIAEEAPQAPPPNLPPELDPILADALADEEEARRRRPARNRRKHKAKPAPSEKPAAVTKPEPKKSAPAAAAKPERPLLARLLRRALRPFRGSPRKKAKKA